MSDLVGQSIDMCVPTVLRIRETGHDDEIVIGPRERASGRAVTGTVAKKHDECIRKPCRNLIADAFGLLPIRITRPRDAVDNGVVEGRYASGGGKIKMNSRRLEGAIREVDPSRDLPGSDSCAGARDATAGRN